MPECPFCKAALKHHKDLDFFSCTDCGGEWWPEEDKEIAKIWQEEQRYKRSISRRGGGESRKKKGKTKKRSRSRSWLYET